MGPLGRHQHLATARQTYRPRHHRRRAGPVPDADGRPELHRDLLPGGPHQRPAPTGECAAMTGLVTIRVLDGVAMGLLFFIVAAGLSLTLGTLRVLNLSHGL